MKAHTSSIVFSIVCLFLSMYGAEHFDIILKQKWRTLGNIPTENTIDFGGEWILVGSITFKKKSKHYMSIDSINLRWNGKPIDNLIASLYKKLPNKEFLPIEDNLICDGLWNKKKQTLVLNFDEKESLGPLTKFYLVLTIPEELEPILKQGSFHLEEQCLPGPFKQCISQEKLVLATNTTPQPTSSPKKIQ